MTEEFKKLPHIQERSMSVAEFEEDLWDTLDSINAREPIKLERAVGHRSIIVMTDEMYHTMVQATHLFEVDMGIVEPGKPVRNPTTEEIMKEVKKKLKSKVEFFERDVKAGYYTKDEAERIKKLKEQLSED